MDFRSRGIDVDSFSKMASIFRILGIYGANWSIFWLGCNIFDWSNLLPRTLAESHTSYTVGVFRFLVVGYFWPAEPGEDGGGNGWARVTGLQ
jgi:hypothetical protein